MNAYQAIHGLLSQALSTQQVHVLGEALELSPATRGLLAQSPRRVHLLPAADASLVGVGIGLALAGARPVIELASPASLWGVLQQLGQEAAPLRAAGEFSAPLVLRVPLAPGESVPLDVLTSLQGVTVACPADADDAVAMLRAALSSRDPVVLLEPRDILSESVQDAAPADRPLVQARVLREGTDATVLAWGPTVRAALAAAEALAAEGVSAEVVDLRALSPLDEETVGASVRKTGRPVLAGGPSAALLACVRTAFLRLESPPASATGDSAALTEAIRRAVHY